MKTTHVGRTVVENPDYINALKNKRIGDLSFGHFQNALLVSPEGAVPPDGSQLRGDRTAAPVPTLSFLDIIDTEPTGSDLVEVAFVSSIDDQTAPVDEATTAAPTGVNSTTHLPEQLAGGGYSTESGLSLAQVNVLVRRMSTVLYVTNQAAKDPPRLMRLIDTVLRRMLRAQVELRLIQGTGAAPQPLGLLNAAGIQSETGGVTNVERAKLALLKSLNSGGGAPTAFLMSPATRSTYFADDDPYRPGPTVLHKLPVATSEGVPAGKVLVANFADQLAYLDRQEESVSISSSHGDLFARGIVALLGEVRGALACRYPSSVVVFDVIA
jgi:HK97 family phage major capsid protein